ncbi:MAG: TPM domain-containing protein [Burkholderiaceae bacterium]
MSVVRWLRHWFKTPYAVRRAYSEQALERIQQAITDNERAHSGEIRFAVEAALPWSYLKRDAPARQRAAMVFAKLRVWDTEQNNGVLIYVELADRSIEIVADRGIGRRVPRAEWDAICSAMREQFRAGRFEQGTIEGVKAVGHLLARHFPLEEGERNPNELSNRPAVL